MGALRRVRPALAEIALAFAGLLLGLGITLILGALGLFPSAGPFGRSIGFVAGPAITGIGAAFYAWASRAVDMQTGVHGWSGLGEVADRRAGSAGRRVGATEAVVWSAVGIAAALAGSYLLGEIMTALDFPVAEQAKIVSITESARRGEATFELWALAISAVVFAPLAEEALFRGLLFRRLYTRAGATAAFVLSSLCFAAIHSNLAGFVIYMWLGLVFAETLRRTGRLWTAVLVHMGNNAFALSLLVFVPPSS